jgi:predicted RNA-binding Zn-ribbon protein involved in translation (DUF1610 family)
MNKIGWISCADCGVDITIETYNEDKPCPNCGSRAMIIRSDSD